MNDSTQQAPTPEPSNGNEAERTKQVRIAGWTAGVFALFAAITLNNAPTWPVAFGVAAIAAAVAVVCCCILKRG
jgi:hypothetical protein